MNNIAFISFDKVKDNKFVDEKKRFDLISSTGQIKVADGKVGKAARISGGEYLYSKESPDFSNEDFTIDFWIKFYQIAGFQCILATCKRHDADALTIIQNGSALRLCYNTVEHANSSSWKFYGDFSSNAMLNKWQHIALVRQNDSLKVYADGHCVGTQNIGSEKICFYENTPMIIGDYTEFSGYAANIAIDSLRITKGARWTGDFTPPTFYSGQLYLSTTGGRCTA